jgi:glycine dehydrogenase
VFPGGMSRQDKYWAPVNRVDNAYGDRNLVCICPTPDEYRDAAA